MERCEFRNLEFLMKGAHTSSCGQISEPHNHPRHCDASKLMRGQLFFRKNISSCVFAMLCSLVCGLSVSNLLEPLVFTNASDTPRKSLYRYIQTLVHVIKWHLSDLCDADSPARKSLDKVRKMHDVVAEVMTKQKTDKKVYLSQYDMSLVQSGFVAAIIIHPQDFGIQPNVNDLDDYVYLWRFIGTHLGITDQNNICLNGYLETYTICEQIKNKVLLQALKHPPDDFDFMAKAFTDGLNILHKVRLYTPEAVINFMYDVFGQNRERQSIANELRIMTFKFLVKLKLYVPGFQILMNKLVMLVYNLVTNNYQEKQKQS
ncbi:uncharacterized protein LOC132550826 [Ylistrum balloti]|uniref:uncharacterized protein LOC132550826 n=1 Tax=Ylistrum balloti TaxID=509963 RepID=UPI002905B7F8|nr:uncharacterized protein LOC132550826 [Ylistrum balloti]